MIPGIIILDSYRDRKSHYEIFSQMSHYNIPILHTSIR